MRSSFPTEIQDSIQLIQNKAQEVNQEVALAKAQADSQEQQLQMGERKLASENRRAFSSLAAQVSSEIEEAKRWRAEITERRRSE